MELFGEADFPGGLFHGEEGMDGVVLPRFAGGEDIGAEADAETAGVVGDAADVVRADVNGFVEDGERVKGPDGSEGSEEVVGIAFRVGGGDGDKDMEARCAGRLKGGQPLAGCRGAGFVDFGEVVAERGQAHAEQQARAKGAEQIEILPRQGAAGEDAHAQGGVIPDQFQRPPHKEPSRLRKLPSARQVGMADSLIGIGGGAVDDGAVAVRFEVCERRVFRGSQGGEEFLLIPAAQQDIIAPFRVRVFDAVFGEKRPHFDRGRAGHITEPAGVGAADGGVERPIG